MFVGQPVQSDGPLPAAAPEEALDGVVPAQLVVLGDAAIGRLEVSVVTLEAAAAQVRPGPPAGSAQPSGVLPVLPSYRTRPDTSSP